MSRECWNTHVREKRRVPRHLHEDTQSSRQVTRLTWPGERSQCGGAVPVERRAHVLGTRDRSCARIARLEITRPHCVIAADEVILQPLLILGIDEEIRRILPDIELRE